MDIDEQHRSLYIALGGARQLLSDATASGDADAIREATTEVRRAEEALAWFEHEMGMVE
jgi:hypothetical protein